MSGPVLDPEPDEFRLAMGRFAAGVTVVTCRGRDLDHAMTANAVASVSLEPTLMLLSVEREARFHDAVVEAGSWGVSILPAAARPIAAWLSTRGRPLHDQLERVPFHRGEATGVALLDDALAAMECETTNTLVAGDHTIIIGRVRSVEIADHPGEALVYYRGRYESLG